MTDYLKSQDISYSAYSPAGDILSIQVTVEQANALFNAQYDTFEHEADGATTVRTLEYSIPQALKGHLEFVHPTVTCVPSPSLANCHCD